MANVWWKFDLQLIRAGDEEELRRVRAGLGFCHDAVAGFKVSTQQLDWGIPDGEYDNELRFATYLREMKASKRPTVIPGDDLRTPTEILRLTPSKASRMIAASKARKLEKSLPMSKFKEIVA